MKLNSISAFSEMVTKPRVVKLEDCEVYVKQLKLNEVDALMNKFGDESKTNEANQKDTIDVIASVLTDEKGELLFKTEEDKKILADSVTLDFVNKFFAKFFEGFTLNNKELASAEAQFRE